MQIMYEERQRALLFYDEWIFNIIIWKKMLKSIKTEKTQLFELVFFKVYFCIKTVVFLACIH